MIRTDVIELDFIGDGLAQSFDVLIEGIPMSPEGKDNFAVTLFDGGEAEKILVYGVDYRYETVFDPRGFPRAITLELSAPLPTGNRLVIVRTTPILNLSEYPDNGVPPRQVEGDFDHVIKILQEQGYDIDKLREDLTTETEERKEEDEKIWEELDNKINRNEPLPAHAEQHFEGAFDALAPENIGALRKAPANGKAYLATTAEDGTPGWIELIGAVGQLSATTVVQVGFFTADGVSTEFGVSVAHSLSTDYVNAIVYDNETNKRIHFAVEVPNAFAVVLRSTAIQPVGRSFRVLIYGPGRIDPAWLKGSYEHRQTIAATTWEITHNLTNRKPLILVFDEDGNEIICQKDYAQATDNSITLTMYAAISGTARVYGWEETLPQGGFEIKPKPFSFVQRTPSDAWTILHELQDRRPTVLVLNNTGVIVKPDIDYAHATPTEITLRFHEPQTGTALIGAR